MADRFPELPGSENLGDQLIKQLVNSVIAKYRVLPVSRRSITVCFSPPLQQIIDDQLATERLRYFAQPRPIIAFDEGRTLPNLLGYL